MKEGRSSNFGVEEVNHGLASRGLTSGGSALMFQCIKFVVEALQLVILARILSPQDFGLIAMVLVIINFATRIKDAGIAVTIVQSSSISGEQASNIFWINLVTSLLLMFVVVIGSPLISWVYDESRLVPIVCALAVNILLRGLSVQHEALLRRQFRFMAFGAIEAVSIVLAAVSGIGMALQGLEYWALAAAILIKSTAQLFLSWFVARWRPTAPRMNVRMQPILKFGQSLTLANAMGYMARKADDFLIGIVWGPGQLGLYSKAYQLLLLPLNAINIPISNVVISMLSRLQDDSPRFRRYYKIGLEILLSLSLPVALLLLLAVNDLVPMILGDQWAPSIGIFQALAAAAIVGCVDVCKTWVYIPLGRGRQFVVSKLFGSIASLFAFVIGLGWGVIGVAIAISVIELVKFPFQTYYAVKGSPVDLRDIRDSIWRPLVAGFIAAITTWSLTYLFSEVSAWARILLISSVFICSYLSILFMLPGTIMRMRMLELLKGEDV